MGQYIAIHPEYVTEVKNDKAKWAAIVLCSIDFREFLNYWHFQDPESGEVKILGNELWLGQEEFVNVIKEHDMVFSLKARKLGYTTLACAFDGWCMRFRDKNGRVHLFSRREGAAADLVERTKFGLKRLPEYMQLPISKDSQLEFRLKASSDDERVCQGYPADENTASEQTCTHAHVDEWWRMKNPQAVWGTIQPTLTHSCHLITNGKGSIGYPADFWHAALNGASEFYPMFVGAQARPGRDESFFQNMRETMTDLMVRHEYPLTWQDALAGSNDLVFRQEHLERTKKGAYGTRDAVPNHSYIKSWDIGRHMDATVGIVLDTSVRPMQVVEFYRVKNANYPMLQGLIEISHNNYPGITIIEDNNAGEAVRENLSINPREVEGWKTTKPSKALMLSQLVLAIENDEIKIPSEYEQLHNELQTYTWEDQNITQDSVMALAIGVAKAKSRNKSRIPSGRIVDVIEWG
jgi:hypothetical protein